VLYLFVPVSEKRPRPPSPCTTALYVPASDHLTQVTYAEQYVDGAVAGSCGTCVPAGLLKIEKYRHASPTKRLLDTTEYSIYL
jgi:hypothetical protein